MFLLKVKFISGRNRKNYSVVQKLTGNYKVSERGNYVFMWVEDLLAEAAELK